MVSGDGFMERKRHHFPLRPGIRFIKVDEVGSRARPIGCSLAVISRRGIRCERRGNGFHAIRLAGQRAKHFHQVRIDRLGQRLVSHKQLFRRLVKELWIGAQELEKLVARSLEPGLLHDPIHFDIDARHFLQSDLVHLFRSFIRGGVVANHLRVQRFAMGKLPCAHLFITRGQILVYKELLKFCERRHNLLLHGLARCLLEPLLINLADLLRKGLERFVETALCGIAHNLLVDLGWNALHDDPWMHHALPHSLAQQSGKLIQRHG